MKKMNPGSVVIKAKPGSQRITTANYCKHFAVALQTSCTGTANRLHSHCNKVALSLHKGATTLQKDCTDSGVSYPESGCYY